VVWRSFPRLCGIGEVAEGLWGSRLLVQTAHKTVVAMS
jgi:hypothetical protein